MGELDSQEVYHVTAEWTEEKWGKFEDKTILGAVSAQDAERKARAEQHTWPDDAQLTTVKEGVDGE
jgi:hypothetical protein